MQYNLRHKDIEVAEIQFNTHSHIVDVKKILAEKHLPVGITEKNKHELSNWWERRAIPGNRRGLDRLVERTNLTPMALMLKSYGLSLSDCYWVCPAGCDWRWADVNFFANEFAPDLGDLLFDNEMPEFDNNEDLKMIDWLSPDSSSDGWLTKKWVIVNGKRLLIKGGSGAFQQEPYNEVIAGTIMEKLKIPHVPYCLSFEKGKPYSICETFLDVDHELVSAYSVMRCASPEVQHSNRYERFLDCCERLGMGEVDQALQQMLVVDYIIANEDRHLGNFGFVREANTLEWQGFAPIFDSGSSLWYNNLKVGEEVYSKPFHHLHERQLNLIKYFSWFAIEALTDIQEAIAAVFAPAQTVDERRALEIAELVKQRAMAVERKK